MKNFTPIKLFKFCSFARKVWKNTQIETETSMRRGRHCTVPVTCGRQAVKSLRKQSFQMAGPKLFNSLPKSKLDFKEELDQFLAKLLDHPQIGDLTPNICNQFGVNPSNSLVDVIPTMKVYGGG